MLRYINLPSGFKATPFGGWCSPLGVYHPRYANISSDPILRSRGLDPRSHDKRFESIEDIAYATGWFQVVYKQRKKTSLREFDESSNALRTVTFRCSPLALRHRQQQRLYDTAKFFVNYFEEGETRLRLEAFDYGNIHIDRRVRSDSIDLDGPIEITTFAKTYKKYPFFRLGFMSRLSTKQEQG